MAKMDVGATTLPPLYEKIERMSKGTKVLIYCAAFLLLIGLFVAFLYYPKYDDLKKLDKEFETQINAD